MVYMRDTRIVVNQEALTGKGRPIVANNEVVFDGSEEELLMDDYLDMPEIGVIEDEEDPDDDIAREYERESYNTVIRHGLYG